MKNEQESSVLRVGGKRCPEVPGKYLDTPDILRTLESRHSELREIY
jgi:hypothetical protein